MRVNLRELRMQRRVIDTLYIDAMVLADEARSYFDEREAPRACGVLTAVRKEAPLSAVEVPGIRIPEPAMFGVTTSVGMLLIARRRQ